MARILRMIAGVVVSAGCLVFAFRSVPVHELLTTITSVSYVVVLGWAALSSVSLWLRTARWRILLNAVKSLPLGTVFVVNSAGLLGNAILPARLGDIFRATNLGGAGLNSGFTLATVFGERVFDTIYLLSISAMALTSFRELPAWLVRGSRLLAVVAGAGVAFAVLLPRLEKPLSRLIHRIAPERWGARLIYLVEQFVDGLRSLRHPGRVFAFLVFTIAIWSLDGAGAIILGRALAVTLSPAVAVLLLTAVALSSALPAAPGNIGVYQVVAVSVLAPFGVGRPQALGLAILLQVLILANLLIWGLGSLWFLAAKRPHASEVPAELSPK